MFSNLCWIWSRKTSASSFYKENNFKPCLTKQLLNMFKLWCEQGIILMMLERFWIRGAARGGFQGLEPPPPPLFGLWKWISSQEEKRDERRDFRLWRRTRESQLKNAPHIAGYNILRVHKLDGSYEPPVYRSLQCGNQQLSQPRFQSCARRNWFAAILKSSGQRWRLDSSAKGISREIPRADAGDEVLANHFSQAANRAKYTSPTIQNESISILWEQIRESIVIQIPSDAPFFLY